MQQLSEWIPTTQKQVYSKKVLGYSSTFEQSAEHIWIDLAFRGFKTPHELLEKFVGTGANLNLRTLVPESSITREVDCILKEFQGMGIRINKPDELHEYLFSFPEIVDVMIDIVMTAYRELPKAGFTLQVYRDPEVDDQHLVLFARFQSYDEFTMEKIKEVRKAFRERLAGKKGWILLTTDFQKVE